jgi:hypothetical protein
MSDSLSAKPLKERELYLLRAEQAHAEAEKATLDNVRERCLRAEAAWMEMAMRAERTEKMRATQLAAKAALLQSAAE